MKILNAFSLQMAPADCMVKIQDISLETVKDSFASSQVESAIGHQDTANVLSSMLGINIAFNRANVSLKSGDSAIVAQVTGGRLPEGATTLPQGTGISFRLVTIL